MADEEKKEDEVKHIAIKPDDGCSEIQATEAIILAEPTITITATSRDIERELNFPANISREELTTSLSYELGPQFKPTMIEKMVETVDNKGISIKDIELSMTWEEGFRIRISMAPKKIIKSFFKIKGEQ